MTLKKNIELLIIGSLSIIIISAIILTIVYPQFFMGILPFAVNILFIGLFGLFFYTLQCKSYKISFNKFMSILFRYSVLLCFFYIAMQYILSYCYTPEKFPIDIGISDNYEYDKNGKIVKTFFKGEKTLSEVARIGNLHYSDMGFPIFIGFFYYVFGDYQLSIKIASAISVGITSVIIAKTVKEIAKDGIAKMTGIVYATIPTIGYLSGFFLKESIMMMIVSIALFSVIKSMKFFSVLYIVVFFTMCFTLFYFRTYLAVCVLSVFFIGNLFQENRQKIYSILSVMLFILIIIASLNFSYTDLIQEDVKNNLNRLTLDEQYFTEKTQTSSDLAKLGTPILLVLSPIFPLPSMLDLRSSMNIESVGVLYRIHIDIIRILLLFWGYIGIYDLIKKQQIKYFLIFLIPLLLLMIINSFVGVLTYFRYQFMILLFLSPFIACGISSFYYNYRRNVRLYICYCVIIFILILVYNIIRTDYIFVAQ